MVVFVDFDEEGAEGGVLYKQGKYLGRYEDKNHFRQYPNDGFVTRVWSSPENGTRPLNVPAKKEGCDETVSIDQNRVSGFAAALGCYPYVAPSSWLL